MLVVFALPGCAMAVERFSSAGFGVHVGLSFLGLIVAVVLLVEALGVRRLTLGGAIADKISLVLLAVFCLAASALAEWGTNFVIDLTLEQVQLASEVLVVVAMALLAAYFWTVRTGMKRYLAEVTHARPGDGDAAVPTPTRRDERV
jgi:hypothetical protein